MTPSLATLQSSQARALGIAAAAFGLCVGILLGRWQQQRRLKKLKNVILGGVDPIWATCGLSAAEIERFGRQIVLPKLGVAGQHALLNKSALIVGAGGLGCPVALYLSAAGVGCVGIVDGDTVAVSNLHRQVGHSLRAVGQNKAGSLCSACLAINDRVNAVVHARHLTSLRETTELVARYDLVVDCTDSPTSRYLINDAAVAAAKPLVAPSAVGLNGQLAVYNLDGGPCLRCVFPDPPGAEGMEPVASCEENGVLGPVPGVLGMLAAVEALKLLAGGPLSAASLRGRLLLYDSMNSEQPCQTLSIRKRPSCCCCGGDRRCTGPTPMPCGCAVSSPTKGLSITPKEFLARLRAGDPMVIIDVRQKNHFAVTRLAASENWPLAEIARASSEELRARAEASFVVCVCRRGIDSMKATLRMREVGVEAWNLENGLLALDSLAQPPFSSPGLT